MPNGRGIPFRIFLQSGTANARVEVACMAQGQISFSTESKASGNTNSTNGIQSIGILDNRKLKTSIFQNVLISMSLNLLSIHV